MLFHIFLLECLNDPRVYAKEIEDLEICNIMSEQTPALPLVPLALIILNKRMLPLHFCHLLLIFYVPFRVEHPTALFPYFYNVLFLQ